MFQVELSNAIDCNVEIPPDACLRRGNGIVELNNPTFHMLVFWQPVDENLLAGTNAYLARNLGRGLGRALSRCNEVVPDVSLASRKALEAFRTCVLSELGQYLPYGPRVFAILPRAMLGHRCPDGHLLIDEFTRPGFEIIVILLPW